jgi:hypothetical protein
MFRSAWDQRSAQGLAFRRQYEREAAAIGAKIDALLDRVVSASSAVGSVYEKRIEELQRSRLVALEKAKQTGKPMGTFDANFELAFGFLSHPSKLWNSGEFEHQRLVLRLTFADRLAWSPESGFSNPKTTMPFSMLGTHSRPFEGLAEREGDSAAAGSAP